MSLLTYKNQEIPSSNTVPKKFLIPLVLPYVNNNSKVLKINICQLVSRTYHSPKPIVILYPNQSLDLGAKIQQQNLNTGW